MLGDESSIPSHQGIPDAPAARRYNQPPVEVGGWGGGDDDRDSEETSQSGGKKFSSKVEPRWKRGPNEAPSLTGVTSADKSDGDFIRTTALLPNGSHQERNRREEDVEWRAGMGGVCAGGFPQ